MKTTTYFKFAPLLVILTVSSLNKAQSQGVAINTTGNPNNTGAILDMSNNNTNGSSGFLPPYVSLTSSTVLTTPITGGTGTKLSGLVVYNTNTSTSNGLSGPGLYYWNNTLATPAWVFISSSAGGVTSVTGTAPINVTPTTGAPVVSLQGAAGTVCYGTGGGSAFNSAGVAPTAVTYAAAATPLTAQVLVSDGAGIPTWNYAGGATLVVYKGFSTNAEATLASYTEANITAYWSSCYDALYPASNSVTQIRMPHCVVTNLHIVPNANATTKATTWVVNNETRATNFTGVLPAATATGTNISGTLTFSDGDMLDISSIWQPGSTGALSVIKLEVQYYLLP